LPSPDLLLAFLAATVIFAAVPGPAMLYAAARTMAGGRAAGLMAALGIHLGGYVHVLIVATGLSLAFQNAPMLFVVLKLMSAAYIAWLGLALFCARATGEVPADVPRPASSGRAFRESVAVEVLNPATAIFFLGFLPQFVDASSSLPVWAQLLLLGTAVNLILSAAEVMVVVLAGTVITGQRGQAHGLGQRVAGLILVGLALHLAVSGSLA
jgi:threonine/homoserine/homoserine lactone efflux protein